MQWYEADTILFLSVAVMQQGQMLVRLMTLELLPSNYVSEDLAESGLHGRQRGGGATDEHTHNVYASRQKTRHLHSNSSEAT